MLIRRRTAAVALALLTLAAACTSSGDEAGTADADTTTASSTTTAATTPDTTGGAATSDAPTTTGAPLTASFRGVTPDAIRIGVSFVDLEAVFDLVMLDHGDYEGAFRAVIDSYNEAGGVLGRRIEPVFEAVDPIGTDPATEACIRLTEDEEVFAVVGQFLDETPLCYVETHDTALIGGDITAELLARANAPWFSNSASPERLNTSIVQAFIDNGEYDGATVGLVGAQIDQQSIESTVLPTLSDADVDVVETAFLEDHGGDEVAGDAEVAVVAERFSAAGVDTVVVVDAAVIGFLRGLEEIEYRPRLTLTSLGNTRAYIRDEAARDLSVLEGSVAGNQAEQLIWWDDPALQDCIDIVEEALDTEIIDPNNRAEGEPEDIVSVFHACQTMALFVAIATAAGPDLTNESFEAAGEGLGTLQMPGLGEVRFGPDKHDGAESIYFYRWDDEAQDLISDGTSL